MTVGIYALKFQGTEKLYIGQSIDVEARYSTHIYKMKYGIANNKLNKAYLKFGKPKLLVLLECTDQQELDINENLAIAIFDCVSNGFNICATAGGGTNQVGEDVGNSKFSNEEIVEAFMQLVYSQHLSTRQISDLTGVSKCVIDKISCYQLHKWLKVSYPDEYSILEKRTNLSRYGKGKTLKERGIIYPNILSPENVSYQVENTSQFAKDHKLNNAHLVQVLKGQERQHKGWRLEC